MASVFNKPAYTAASHSLPLLRGDVLRENVSAIHWKKNPIIVIIGPLLALTHDQVKKLSSLGFKTAFVGLEQDPKILQDIERGNFTFVYLAYFRVCT